MKVARITVNPEYMGGMPCIHALRISAGGMVADGMSAAAILDFYLDLQGENVHGALLVAAETMREHEVPLTMP